MSDLNDKEIAEQQGKILAPASFSDNEREIWIKGYTHGRILGLSVGRREERDAIARKMLMCNYSTAEISELTATFEEYIESLGKELKLI